MPAYALKNTYHNNIRNIMQGTMKTSFLRLSIKWSEPRQIYNMYCNHTFVGCGVLDAPFYNNVIEIPKKRRVS